MFYVSSQTEKVLDERPPYAQVLLNSLSATMTAEPGPTHKLPPPTTKLAETDSEITGAGRDYVGTRLSGNFQGQMFE